MANMMALNTVYNHYLTTYSHGSMTKYDTHKKSELRDIYHSIVKLNKESPLYLADTTKESRAFAVGIKEGARELHNTIAALGGIDEAELLNKKVAFSSDENILSAQYIGTATDEALIPSYEIEVRSLASPQINLGGFLPAGELALSPDTYSFDISTSSMNYEFQYNVSEGDTNKSIQEKLVRLISGADIGIIPSVVTDGDLSALRLESAATGMPINRDDHFSVSDTHTSKTSGSVACLGIGEVTRPASNAELVINGIEKSTASNHFTLEKTYELKLNGISPVEGQTAVVGVKNDTESLKENVSRLINGYNSFLNTTLQHTGDHTRGTVLLREMRSIASIYKDSLNHLGLDVQEDGSFKLGQTAYTNVMSIEDPKEAFSTMRDFADSLLRKTEQISLNPMHYVEKTIVAYKNPGKNFATPYITSAYSGMMFNSYC